MPDDVCLRSKFPLYSSGESDGAAAFDGGSSLYKPRSPVNGGSHDIEGWMPVENAANNTDYARIPYAAGNFASPVRTKFTDGSTSTWVTWHGGTGYAVQINLSTGNLSDGETITDNWTGNTNNILCTARRYQTWYTSMHVYAALPGGTTPSGCNFSWWVFQVDSNGNWKGSGTTTIDLNAQMTGSINVSDEGSVGRNNIGGLGFSNRYNGVNTQANPYYNSSHYAFNFLVHELPKTDYTFYECYFTLGNWSSTDGLTMRFDMDNAGFACQIDEVVLRPVDVSMQDTNGGSGTNISLDDIVNA